MARTNETFFENVRIPASCLLGEENQGWYVGAMGLNLDRVGASRYLISVRRDEDIVNWVKENDFGGHSPSDDPAVRDKLAELWTEAQVCRLMTMRSMSLVNRGDTFTYEGSAEKVWAPEHGVHTHRGYLSDSGTVRSTPELISGGDRGTACTPTT